MATGDEDYEDTPTIETSHGSHQGHEIVTSDDINDAFTMLSLTNTKSQQSKSTATIANNPSATRSKADHRHVNKDPSLELQIIYSDRKSQTHSQQNLMPTLAPKASSNIPSTDLAPGGSNISALDSSGDEMDGFTELPPKTISKINATDVNLAFAQNKSNTINKSPRSKSKTYTVELSPKPKTSFRASIKSNASKDGFEIDVGTDTDSDDELDEENIHKIIDMKRVETRYDDNEFKHLPYEQELIERLSIALTYLLHEKSPLWITEDEKDDYDYEYDEDVFLSAISPKSERESMKSNQKPKFEYKYSTEKASFQKKCLEYATNSEAMMGQLRTAEKKLNSLYDQTYHARWKSLHYFWVDWKQHAEMLLHEHKSKKEGNEEAMDNEDDDEPFDELTLEEEEKLEVT